MDAYGHVNNAVYFRYFEIARIKLLERIGFLETFETNGIGAILHSTSCRFRKPLHYPDTAHVGTAVSSLEVDRFVQRYVVRDDSGALAAEGESVVVSYDYRARQKAPIPESVLELIPRVQTG